MLYYLLIFSLAAIIPVPAAAPTEPRIWKSTAGTSLEARAKAIEDGVAVLEAADGRILRVPLDKLIKEDRELLASHFTKAMESGESSAHETAELAHPPGQTSGPIEANGSRYYVHLPSSLKAGRTHPLLFYTSAGGGGAGTLQAMKEGAEICGWIIACSVESKNGQSAEINHDHVRNCIGNLSDTLPIDPKRIYFSGSSGGARMAFYNASKMKGAGVIAQIAGARDEELDRGKNYFFISGAYDYNRYGIAHSFARVKRTGALRFHPGGHSNGPDWLMTEGMVWQESQWHRQTRSNEPAKADFETAAAAWVEKLRAEDENRAAWWISHFTNAGFKAKFAGLQADVGATAAHAAYIKGVAALEDYAADVLAGGPRFSPGCFEHTRPEIQRKADKLLEVYGETPWLKDILNAIKRPTGKS